MPIFHKLYRGPYVQTSQYFVTSFSVVDLPVRNKITLAFIFFSKKITANLLPSFQEKKNTSKMWSPVEWDSMLPSCYLQALSSRVSDHCPLVLVRNSIVCKFESSSLRPFGQRFRGDQEVVAQAWPRPTVVFNCLLRLHIKLQRTSKRLNTVGSFAYRQQQHVLCAEKQFI